MSDLIKLLSGSSSNDRRAFIVEHVSKPGQKGKQTKHNASKAFRAKSPSSAASKAFSKLCRQKKIKGRCTLNVTIREVQTQNGRVMKSGDGFLPKANKSYRYRLKRRVDKSQVKLRNGSEIMYKYKTKVKALKPKKASPVKGR